MIKLLAIFNTLKPLLKKKMPMFSQTVGQFSTSKSNFVGSLMIAAGLYMLYLNHLDTFGVLLVTNGAGLITLKDAAVKNG